MTAVQYYAAATLDGYIADPDDGLGWLFAYSGSYDAPGAEAAPMSEGGPYERFYDGVGALVSGSATYEFLLAHGGAWPYPGKPYWVLSSRELERPDDPAADVRAVSGDVAGLAAELLASAGEGNLWVVGGGDVASQFTDAGLLDELWLTVVPVVIGEGKPLFDDPLADALDLVSATPFNNGMVELRYKLRGRPAGAT